MVLSIYQMLSDKSVRVPSNYNSCIVSNGKWDKKREDNDFISSSLILNLCCRRDNFRSSVAHSVSGNDADV